MMRQRPEKFAVAGAGAGDGGGTGVGVAGAAVVGAAVGVAGTGVDVARTGVGDGTGVATSPPPCAGVWRGVAVAAGRSRPGVDRGLSNVALSGPPERANRAANISPRSTTTPAIAAIAIP